MTYRVRAPAWAIVLALLGVTSRAQNPPPPQVPPFKSGVDLVAVDLTVMSDDGSPVNDLRLDQVRVRVDGVPRKPVSLQFVRGEAANRRIVFVVDRAGIPAGEGQALLAATARFIDGLAPTDRIASWILPEATGRLAFTTNHDPVKQAVLRAVGTAPRSPDVVNIGPGEAVLVELGDQSMLDAVVARECGRRAPGGTPCSRIVRLSASRRVLELRDHAVYTLRSLLDLVRALGGLEGPKHLIFLTGSLIEIPELLPAIREISAAAAAARVHIHTVPLPKAFWIQSAEARTPNTPEWMSGANPASAAGSLALSTGGFSSTFLAPGAAFDRLERELSAAYLLAFEPAPSDRDGKSHAVEVTVGVPDAKVRARRQFRVTAAEAGVSTATTAAPPTREAAAPGSSASEPLPDSAASPAVPDSFVADLMVRVGTYITQFEREFSSVVAEERYVQIAKPWTGPPKSFENEPALLWDREDAERSPSRIVRSRRIRSDVLLVQAADDLWVSYRDVFEVDGKPVRNRDERVKRLLLSASGGRAELRRISAESSRYNIGVGVRTVNTPTFALLYLHPRVQPRVRFSYKGTEVIDGHACTVIEYRESKRSSLVSTTKGESVPGEGRFWVELDTGRVRRVESILELTATSRAVLQVTFGDEPGVGVLVPHTMWEWYTGAPARLATRSVIIAGAYPYIEALAKYTNFRRFRVETVERIK